MNYENYLAVDCETTGLNFSLGARPFAVYTCDSDGCTGSFLFPVNPQTRTVHYPHHIKNKLWEHLINKRLIFHNAKFDIRSLSYIFPLQENRAIFPDNIWSYYEDTLLLSHIFNSSEPHGLKALAEKYLNFPNDDEEELKRAVRKERRTYDSKGEKVENDYFLCPEECNIYGENDVKRTFMLFVMYHEMLLKPENHRLQTIYEDHIELQHYLYEMESHGITIDEEELDKLMDKLSRKAKLAEKAAVRIVRDWVGEDFNIRSNQQTKKLIYERMLGVNDENKLKLLKTDVNALQKVSDNEDAYDYIGAKDASDVAKHILTYRKNFTGVKYLKNYKERLVDGRLYFTLNPVGTHTTRMSSNNPNTQNVSKDESLPLRRVFSPMGKVWLCADYQQLQLRLFAYMSEEESLIQAFEIGYDFHSYVAQELFHKPLEQISETERRTAKNVNFAIIFGAGEAKVDLTAGVPGLYRKFKRQFPNAASYMKYVAKEAKEKGYVRLPNGYRLRFPADKPYIALNYLIQGTEGIIVKDAMLSLGRRLRNSPVRMVLQVHDEIIFEAKHECILQQYQAKIQHIMESAGLIYGVVTPVDFKYVKNNWADG